MVEDEREVGRKRDRGTEFKRTCGRKGERQEDALDRTVGGFLLIYGESRRETPSSFQWEKAGSKKKKIM